MLKDAAKEGLKDVMRDVPKGVVEERNNKSHVTIIQSIHRRTNSQNLWCFSRRHGAQGSTSELLKCGCIFGR